MINGSTATSTRVSNLFQSVQLNVNNPHFLIMQGRIAKVINMKPVEVLGMIEEAAGTRMFENKKLNCLKTMEKKDTKIVEIDRVMQEDIKPRLEKLRAQLVPDADYAAYCCQCSWQSTDEWKPLDEYLSLIHISEPTRPY